MRIDRYLSNSGYGTRSDVRSLIRAGRVTIDGRPVTDPSFSGFPEEDSLVAIDGEPIRFSRFIYIALYKPDGYLTAMEDKRLPTVADLLPSDLLGKGISPVGRLDYHTTGLLIITNNGTLSHRLTSPKWHAEKVYYVTFEGEALTETEQELFASGMTLIEDGHVPERLAPAKLEPTSENTCLLTLTEGRSHQVKRMLAQVNRPVIALHRKSVAGVCLQPSQKPGDYRFLDKTEVQQLFYVTKMDPSQI
jgi:16S rRNA pseudouridine516 synthase